MADLSLLHYTASVIPDGFAALVRRHLLTHGIPIVSVSQKPLEFGDTRVCVGTIGASIYNCYRQILAGALRVGTEFVACCEDDTLYPPEHFALRPCGLSFAYVYRWTLHPDGRFFFRRRIAMSTCIVQTELLIRTLEGRFRAFPEPPAERIGYKNWGEPGRFEHRMGLPSVGYEIMNSEARAVTFNHRGSLGGFRRVLGKDLIATEVAPWGDGRALWKEYWR